MPDPFLFPLGAVLLGWLIAGALYLLWRALKSARAAQHRLFLKGLALHLTNPKAILSWGSVYAITLAPGAGPAAVWHLFAVLSLGSVTRFFGYGLIFSAAPVAHFYARTKRGFDAAFAAFFGTASFKLLTWSPS